MRKFTKCLMALALLVGGAVSVDAKTQIDGGLGNLVVPKTYSEIGAYGGTWSGGFNYATDGGKDWAGQDWSAYDYVWVKYSGLTGKINFGITYSEFVADHESWGEFVGESTSMSGTSGIVGIKLDKTSVYVKGTAETDGSFIGDVYAKHIREIWIQSFENGSGVTLEELWVGSEAEYMEAIGFDTSKNHMLLFTNGAVKTNLWDYQAKYNFSTPLTKDKKYVFEAIIKAVNGGETRLVVNGGSSSWLETKGLWANEFTRYQVEFTAKEGNNELQIDLGHVAGEVYIENVSLKEKDTDVNLIANGDFEAPGTTGWSAVGNTMAQVEYVLGTIKDPGILISVGAAGWMTFRTGSAIEITDPSVKAYVAKYVADGNYVKLTEVTAVPAWQSVLIEAPEGKYMVDIPAKVEGFPSDDNDLQANDGTPKAGDGTLYGLASKNGVVGFYKVATTSEVPAWKIYLKIAAADAPEFLPFEGNTTGIESVKASEAKGEFFNLAGQRVAQPAKGLYIVNGKKVIFK